MAWSLVEQHKGIPIIKEKDGRFSCQVGILVNGVSLEIVKQIIDSLDKLDRQKDAVKFLQPWQQEKMK